VKKKIINVHLLNHQEVVMDFLFSNHAKKLLKDYYMKPEEEHPHEAFRRAAYAYTNNKALSERVLDYAKKGWFMFSSPILSNAGTSGMPISCFLSYVDDSVEGLIEHTEELRWMSVMGGGVGGHWSHVRSVSDKAPGPIPFLKTVDADMVAYRQGSTRKGSYAAYIDVDHPDIIEFLNIRLPTGGDTNRKCFNLNNAINITDAFMAAVIAGESWNLIDPKTNQVKDSLDARELWQRIIEVRFRTGEPYLNFIDQANKHLPAQLKDKGLRIHGSNLCSEIHLPTSKDRSAVCCLSSLNLELFDEWKDSSIVEDLIEFLDDVLQHFIENAPSQLEKAIFSAKRERSLGLGAMGFHSYLQKNNIPYESVFANSVNRRIFTFIKTKALEATQRLALQKGAYLDDNTTLSRNSHLLAIAPNANSSIILNTSPSIEPWKSNAFTHRTRAGSFLQINKYLEECLRSHKLKLNKTEEWFKEQVQSVILAQGSVQHLDYLSDHEKDVFKTAFEIDQMWVIEHASVRQEWVCQGQSVNLFFPSGSDVNYVNAVHLSAWKKNLKALYYLRTNSGVVAEKVSNKIKRKYLQDYAIEECMSCQG
jgi:ribonucleoside-diphosphate reductase alpha chain